MADDRPQIVQRSGWLEKTAAELEHISNYVKNAWENGRYEDWIEVCHIIQPNVDFDPRKMASKFKAFSSIYYEKGTSQHGQGIVPGR